jgi:tyrosine-protein kinase Etk/Wzc
MEQVAEEEKETGGSFDIKTYFQKLAKNYRWFLLTVVLFLAGAYAYLRYTVPLYQVITYMMLKQPTDALNMLGGSPFASGGGSAGNAGNFTDVNNEIFKLQSASLVGQVVDSLKLGIVVTNPGKIKTQQVDVDSLPFVLTVNKAIEDLPGPLYKLSLSNQHYRLESENVDVNGLYDTPLVVLGDTITVQLKQPYAISKKNRFNITFNGRASTIATYVGRLSVTSLPKSGPGVIQISLKDEIPQRASRIIGVLINKYDAANHEFKNQALMVEMDFLNKRLQAVDSELENQENQVRDFKVGNQIYDVSASAGQLLGTLPSIGTKMDAIDLKKKLLSLVEMNIRNHYLTGSDSVLSNTADLQEPALSEMIARYNRLVEEKQAVSRKGTEQDPRLPAINNQLDNIRGNILTSVTSIRKEIATNESSLTGQQKNISGKYSGLPGKEKQLIEINRLLGIKQSLYIFLLQRREDKNIQFASSDVADSRVVDTKQGKNIQEPKPLMIYGIALGAALLIPALIILLKVLLNNKLESRKEVEKLTSIPIAAEIGLADKKNNGIVITSGSRTPIAEQFRTLRTNLSYFGHGSPQKVLMITSATTNEGKSFISLNLANTIAMSGKKVVLIEFDLRNPGISEKLNCEESAGATNYLISDMHPDEVIQSVDGLDNLFFISAGYPLPPNPGELILNPRMNELFDYLENNFDAVIIDTPPVGIVSDALILSSHVNLSFIIVRQKFSLRSSLKMINELVKEKKLPNPVLILNAIQETGAMAYGSIYAYEEKYAKRFRKKKKNIKVVLKETQSV